MYVLTSDTDHGETEPYRNIVPNQWLYNEALGINICYLEKSTIGFNQVRQEIAFVNPAFIYVNHLFSPYFVIYPLWLKLSNKIKNTVILCPRGTLYDSALSQKRYKKSPLLLLYKLLGLSKKIIFHATNELEKKAIEKHFPGSKIVIADNLPSLSQPSFKEISKEAGSVDCIFVARIVPIKNLLFLLKALKEVKENVTLSVVGPVENEAYWAECETEILSLPVNIKVSYKGAQKNEKIGALIQDHHLFVLPTTGENFGHSIFEALLCGRPVLISDQTPWLHLEAVHAGWALPLSNRQNFSSVISQVAMMTQQEYDVYALGAWQFAVGYLHQSSAKQQYLTLFA